MKNNEDRKLNESGGRVFEFITAEALSILFPNSAVKLQPADMEGMIIQPDIAIYTDSGALQSIILSGHATTKNSAGVKVDRSLEELFEIKECFPGTVVCASFIWHSPNGWATGHIKRMDEAFDYNFVAYRDCADIWESLIPEICDLADEIKGKEEADARKNIAASSIPQLIAARLTALRNLVEDQNLVNQKRWEQFSRQYKRTKAYDKRFVSNVKSALLPLAWLPSGDLERIIAGKTVKKCEQLEAFIRLGGGVSTTAGIKGNADITELQYFFDKRVIAKTIERMQSSEGIRPIIDSLGSADRLSSRIARTAEAVQTGALDKLCADAQNADDVDYTGRCWPFEICTTWVKLKIDNKFGLLEAQREAMGDTRTDYLWDPIIYYTEGQFDKLTAEQVCAVCRCLEEKLKNARPITSAELSAGLLTEMHKEKKYNPLHWIIRETLDFYKIPYNKSYTFQCLFAEQAGLQRSSGRTTYQLFIDIRGKRTIIHALSAYSSTHKDVEFSAKARLCRHKEIGGSIVKDRDVRIVYVLDGTHWPARSMYMLERAGAEVVPITEFSKWVEKNRDSLI